MITKTQFFIESKRGKIDCLKVAPTDITVINPQVAIIFHPDPLQGGSYTNKVVQIFANTLANRGFTCICPNFCGIGESYGTATHDPEIIHDDAMTVFNFLKANSELDCAKLLLGGFSFGAYVASILAAKILPKQLFLIAPPVHHFEFHSYKDKTLVIAGEDDEIVPIDATLKWANQEEQPILVIPKVGHFFNHKLLQLQNIINTYTL